MGLVSFVKSAGRKVGLFGGRAEGVKQAIQEKVDIQDLDVSVEGDTVTLRGSARDQAEAEKAVLAAGNIEGVAAVEDRLEVRHPAPRAAFHTVARGDTLSAIAGHYYGVMRMYDVIVDANRPLIADADEIYPGQVLRIPPVSPPVHRVSQGETLGSIAKHWYGDAKRFRDIFMANRDVLSDPDQVEVGQRLKIPFIEPKVGLSAV